MARRFVDSECWNDPWYHGLSLVNKCFWRYICDSCDCAGVWKVNKPLAEFQIGAPVDWDELLCAMGNRIMILSPEKWLVVKFMKFQYVRLSRNCKPHEKIFDALENHGIAGMLDDLMGSPKGTIADRVTQYPNMVPYHDTLENKIKQEEEENKDSLLLRTPIVTQSDGVSLEEDVCVSESICTEESAGAGARGVGPDPPKKREAVKHKRGEYKHVLLTDDEYDRLAAEWGQPEADAWIKRVDEWCQETGKRKKDYNLTIRKWRSGGWGINKSQNGSKTSTGSGRPSYEFERKHIEALERKRAANG